MLTGTRKDIRDLDGTEKKRMFELMAASYENVTERTFTRDLAEKHSVILLHDRAGILQGFSTVKLIPLERAGERVYVLFSGDTIIDPGHWGSPELFRLFLGLLLDLHDGGQTPLYWFLISKGIRTYLMLPLFLKEFHPAPGAEMPPREREILETVCRMKFGPRWDRDSGIIRASSDSDRMRTEIDLISEKRKHDPHVRFFLERNPGYVKGDELACIGRVTPDNFRDTVLRMVAGVRSGGMR